MVTQAKKEANQAWDRKHMTTLCCRVRREYADKVREACAAQGDTVNGVIKEALDQYLNRYNANEEK